MITSTSNSQIKQLQQLQKKRKIRDEKGWFIIEGLKMFKETPKNCIVQTYVSETLYNKKKREFYTESLQVEVLSDRVFASVSDTKTPQGIMCIVQQQKYTLEDIIKGTPNHLLVLDNLQDPGNLGTILRTAEGAGVTGIIMNKECVDIYNPKVIRGTMGSIYRVPYVYVEELECILDLLKERGIRSFAAHLDGEMNYDQVSYLGNTVFLIGNEGNGLQENLVKKAEQRIRIPMEGKIESLNVAVATSILIYEVYKQRRQPR